MAEEVALLRETVSAQAALVRFVVGVGEKVFASIGGQRKCSGADRALERPFSCVNLHGWKYETNKTLRSDAFDST